MRQSVKLTLMLTILLFGAAAVGTAPAATRPELGSHVSRIQHPFVMSNAQWAELFGATTPDGKRLSARELTPLVVHAE
jgi:hypothetical protein